MTKECARCGAEFETTSNNQLYCSHECYISAKALKGKISKEKRDRERSLREFMLEEAFTLEDYCIAAKAMGLSYGEFQTLPKSVRKPQLLIARYGRMYGKHQHRVKRSISATRGNWSDGNEEESQ